MALKIVGSSPIIHPIKKKGYQMVSFLFYEVGDGGTRKTVKKQSGGLFLGRGKVPQLSYASCADVDES